MSINDFLTPANPRSPKPLYAKPKPPDPLLLVYTRKTTTDRLEAFHAAGPIKDAIKQVVDGGYPRAVVVVK